MLVTSMPESLQERCYGSPRGILTAMRPATFAALALAVVGACAPYPPIQPEDPCASDKLVCGTYPTDPKITFCGYRDTDDAGDERMVNCPRQTHYTDADGGKHFFNR
jgi:hypothetical protein